MAVMVAVASAGVMPSAQLTVVFSQRRRPTVPSLRSIAAVTWPGSNSGLLSTWSAEAGRRPAGLR
ncbi:hypothetical protein [Actinoplanes sp. NPDC026619]|uniref:hypothetical protein n=1 Tax=Actinoplanes sp. NPDC026619 TaxID=3155798 RepID=UPI0034008449